MSKKSSIFGDGTPLFCGRFPLILLLIFCFSGCAVQRSPSGGPPDTTPPRIVEVIPPQNATLVPRDQKVEFTFSESMDRRSLEKAIFITPDPGDRVGIDWGGQTLRVEFEDSLRIDRTYVITLGTDLKDSHGVAMAQSYTLAFSTGEELSDGKISGRVFSDQKKQGVLVWAYILEDDPEPDPAKRSGDYATQTDGQGSFHLTNLSAGTYRVFAVWDKDNNRFFETGLDAIGIPGRDVRLQQGDLEVTNLDFQLTTQDTIGPALISVTAENRYRIRLTFDEELSADGVDAPQNYRITVDGTPALQLETVFLSVTDRKQVIVLTEPQQAAAEYNLRVSNLTDGFGNSIDPNFDSVSFVGSALPDTLGPKLHSTTPKDSAEAVLLDANVAFHFDEPLLQSSFESSFSLTDSLQTAVPGSFEWATPASVGFVPEKRLSGSMRYSAAVRLDSTLDRHGNPAADSTFFLIFTTVNADTFSSISGTITDTDSTGQGRIFMKARPKDDKGKSYEIILESPGPYLFGNILPGTYIIEGFRDRDSNGKYSSGTPVPFEPAERFFVYEQEIKVRARWPNEGNNITF